MTAAQDRLAAALGMGARPTSSDLLSQWIIRRDATIAADLDEGDAFREVEALLPGGVRVGIEPWEDYTGAQSYLAYTDDDPLMKEYGSTRTEALRALAAKLRESKP